LFGNPNIRPVLGSQVLILRLARHAVFVGAFTIAFATGVCHASDLDFPTVTPEGILLAQRAIADTVATPPQPLAAPPGMRTDDDVVVKAKSPGRAFLLDLLVPGAGHLYAGNKRGWIHLGLEGATWVTYLYYHDRGKQKENQYEAYADVEWDSTAYKSSNTYQADRWQLLRNFLASGNSQQYYEDIGKLPDYWTGWQGYSTYPDPGGDAPTRRFYYGIRNDSNNFLKNARYALVGGFVNRLVSAVDVLRLLKNRGHANLGNDTQIKFNMRARPFANENAFKVTVTRRLD